jgi:nitroreductase
MMSKLPNPLESRKSEYPVLPLFLKRWSPRAMSGKSVSEKDLMTLFEAARWAPSTYNEQEWRFLYAAREDKEWANFFGLLLEANQVWCKDASHLIAVISRLTFVRNGNSNPVAVIDTGAAMQNILLQAAELNIVAHPMAGFNWGEAASILRIPEGFAIQAMIAIGQPGDPISLPPELAEREVPTDRKPLADIAMQGLFGFKE